MLVFFCGEYGHWAYRCRQRQHNVRKTEVVSNELEAVSEVVSENGEPEQLSWNFSAVEIVQLNYGGDSANFGVAPGVEAQGMHRTNVPMMMSVYIEEVLKADLECDTAAFHSVISAQLFQWLQQKSGRTLSQCLNPRPPAVFMSLICMNSRREAPPCNDVTSFLC